MGANFWADARTVVSRANKVVTLEDLKEIAVVPSHEMVNCHVHKLV